MPSISTRVLKYVDQAICSTASLAFNVIQFFNKYRPNPSFTPKWSEKPLLKPWQKSKPKLGWPRTTDSLYPFCVKEARERIIRREQDWRTRIKEKVGEIKTKRFLRRVLANVPRTMPRPCPHQATKAIDSNFL